MLGNGQYASEHTITNEQKLTFRDAIRNNRKKHRRHKDIGNISVMAALNGHLLPDTAEKGTQSENANFGMRARSRTLIVAPVSVSWFVANA